MDEKRLKIVSEKLLAIELFAKELREELNSLNAEPQPEKEKAPVVTKAKEVVKEVAPPAEEPKQEEEVNEIEKTISEYELNDLSVEEIKEYLNDNEVDFNKKLKAKDKLLVVLAQAILDGKIPLEGEEEPAGENEEEEQQEEAVEEAREKTQVEAIEEAGELNISAERAEMEAEIADNIHDLVSSKKLTVKKMKDYLGKFYEGDADCKGCKGCKDDEILDCYINLKQSLVDDEGEVHKQSDPYVRDDTNFCCGTELQELDNGNLFCPVCSNEYEAE
jgi:type I site-specific restriction-modification system R (restriction) subunit